MSVLERRFGDCWEEGGRFSGFLLGICVGIELLCDYNFIVLLCCVLVFLFVVLFFFDFKVREKRYGSLENLVRF